jgi:hypothetical protein
LIVACIHDRFDGRSFSSVNASQTFSRVIVLAVTIADVVAVVAALVSTPPETAVASTAASVVFVFTPAPPRAMAESSPRQQRHHPALEDSRSQ